ncbi:hypothetical protein ERO13_D06G220700v2 [Gossypium hirsutum]|nr:hypothetical protein ERO13_D06G220700v2 [Gossypium hirsutum]
MLGVGLFLCHFFVAIFVTPASSEADFRTNDSIRSSFGLGER